MTQQQIQIIDGIEVHIEGEGADTVVMIHGWPDTYRLWDAQVAALKAKYRCIRFTLPGFDVSKPARPLSVTQMMEFFRKVVDGVSPSQPVTLMLHDWGCLYGYEFVARHRDRVARVIGVDIGDHNSGALLRSLSIKQRFLVFAYQFWLALAWIIGGAVGGWMTRWIAGAMGCRSDPARIGAQMNYPYHVRWFGSFGSFRGMARVEPLAPMLYIYGRRKPFMFHSLRWLEKLAATPGCEAHGFATGHWVMTRAPEAFNEQVLDWLQRTPIKAAQEKETS